MATRRKADTAKRQQQERKASKTLRQTVLARRPGRGRVADKRKGAGEWFARRPQFASDLEVKRAKQGR